MSPYVIGQAGGHEGSSITIANMPLHSHPANCNNTPGPNTDPTANFWAESNPGGRDPVATPAYASTSNAQMSNSAIGAVGGGQALSVLQPYLCVNFIIALQGIYPSRS